MDKIVTCGISVYNYSFVWPPWARVLNYLSHFDAYCNFGFMAIFRLIYRYECFKAYIDTPTKSPYGVLYTYRYALIRVHIGTTLRFPYEGYATRGIGICR